MPGQNSQKLEEKRRIVENAALARIGWNVGQEVWGWGRDAIKILWFVFLIFCIMPTFLGLYIIIGSPSHPDWQGHSRIPTQEFGFGFLLAGICGGFLTYLVYRAMRIVARWLARKAGY